MPIFVRPVREQLEHDRLIRFLQPKYKRKQEVTANVGDEQVAPVKVGSNLMYPDLVLTDGKRLTGLVEVETGESVNNLEAMAQWTHFSRLRVPFHLYVPTQVYDAARRLSEANGVRVAEIWVYRPTSDGFDLVRMHHDAAAAALGRAPRSEPVLGGKQPAARPAKVAPAAKGGAKAGKGAKAPKPSKSARAGTVKAKPASKAGGRARPGGGAPKKTGRKPAGRKR